MVVVTKFQSHDNKQVWQLPVGLEQPVIYKYSPLEKFPKHWAYKGKVYYKHWPK